MHYTSVSFSSVNFRQQILSVRKEQHVHCSCCGKRKLSKPEAEVSRDFFKGKERFHEPGNVIKVSKKEESELFTQRKVSTLNIGPEGLSGSLSFHKESQYARNFKPWHSSSFSASKWVEIHFQSQVSKTQENFKCVENVTPNFY